MQSIKGHEAISGVFNLNDKHVKNIAASVNRRLLNLAKEQNVEFQSFLNRFAIYRLLYRLSLSPHRESFILKGAMLFRIWTNDPYRMTRDLDFHYKNIDSIGKLEQIFREICSVPLLDDGLRFMPDTVIGEEIRETQEYRGVRIKLQALLDNAKIPLQIDIGFGDIITPRPKEIEIPTMLDFPTLKIRAYPRETVVAEKLHAMIILGIGNSRMNDFYDLYMLACNFDFGGIPLTKAISATFKRRKTNVPSEIPLALSDSFWNDTSKQILWNAFLGRNGLSEDNMPIRDVIDTLRIFLIPPLQSISKGETFDSVWESPGPWK